MKLKLWSAKQKELKKEHLLEGFQNKVRANDFVDQPAAAYKKHQGPFTSGLKTILQQEIQYQRVTHPCKACMEIYQVNKVSLKKMIENPTLTLSDEHEVQHSTISI